MKRRNMATGALAGVAIAAFVSVQAAASSITVDSVAQRWPWNNKLDITYTVSGGQNAAAGVFARIVFTANIGGTAYTIDGMDIAADASDGTRTVTWNLPSGLRASGCTMTAQLLSSDIPSGDDYMIIDLDTGAVRWEGLFPDQNTSNARYNTAGYKTDKMVLRKIPAGGPYPTGDSANYPSGNDANTSRTWTTDRDYYLGVFPVTQYQYQKIYGSNPSEKKTVIEGNEVAHRPVEKVSWDDLRISTTAATSSIPAVASMSGTFFQRLNFLTGFYFDLPTEVMFEIAARAGATTTYHWGDTMDLAYTVSMDNSGVSSVAVGSKLPNAWGFYDTVGNVWEWCLDEKVNGDLAARADAFTPACTGLTTRRYRSGGDWHNYASGTSFRVSHRIGNSSSLQYNTVGFRVAMVRD